MDRAQENAIEIAKWLKEQDIVKKLSIQDSKNIQDRDHEKTGKRIWINAYI